MLYTVVDPALNGHLEFVWRHMRILAVGNIDGKGMEFPLTE